MATESNQDRLTKALVTGAAVVVVIAGLKLAVDIVLPILLSIFLSIVALPLVRGLQRLRVPTGLAILVVVVVAGGSLLGITGIIAGTVRTFATDIGRYEQPFNLLLSQGLGWAHSYGVVIEETEISSLLKPSVIMGLVQDAVEGLVGVLSQVVIVVVTMTFILFEASELAQKLQVAFGTDSQPGGPLAEAGPQVQRYLLIKTLVSLVTGVLAGLLCRVIGLDFWVMWGLIAFLANYIPSIGSIVAAIPPLLLAIVQLGPEYAVVVALGYLVINVVFGNFIEPRLMGRSLGLSPLVVFLSLIFWGWVWGPVGMLLCVPMTVIVKLVLESSEDTRWVAVFLGSAREIRSARVAAAPPVAEAVEAPSAT